MLHKGFEDAVAAGVAGLLQTVEQLRGRVRMLGQQAHNGAIERVERLAQRRYSPPSHVVRDALVDFLDRADAREAGLADRKAAGGTLAAENPQAKGKPCH